VFQFEPSHAELDESSLQAVYDPRSLANEVLALTARTLGVFLFQRWNRHRFATKAVIGQARWL
jgi:hypothetical protein